MTDSLSSRLPPSRRSVLQAGAAAAVVGSAALLGASAWSQPRKLTFAWSQAGFCLAPVPVALERGFFEKNGLDVELLNWAGSSDQMLESLNYMVDKLGAMPYTTQNANPDFTSSGSVAGTAWLYYANQDKNPYAHY